MPLPMLGALGTIARFGIPALLGYGAHSILSAKPEEQVTQALPIQQPNALSAHTQMLRGLMKEIASIIKETPMSPKETNQFLKVALNLITPLQKDILSPLSQMKTMAKAEADLATALRKEGEAMMYGGNDTIARMLFGNIGE